LFKEFLPLVLREALNIVATARAFFPNGLADLAPIPAADVERFNRFDQAGEAITKATQSGGKVLFTPNA
jgi:hypothetical protein